MVWFQVDKICIEQNIGEKKMEKGLKWVVLELWYLLFSCFWNYEPFLYLSQYDYLLIFSFFLSTFFYIGSHYIFLAGLQLCVDQDGLMSQRSAYLCLLSAGIKFSSFQHNKHTVDISNDRFLYLFACRVRKRVVSWSFERRIVMNTQYTSC